MSASKVRTLSLLLALCCNFAAIADAKTALSVPPDRSSCRLPDRDASVIGRGRTDVDFEGFQDFPQQVRVIVIVKVNPTEVVIGERLLRSTTPDFERRALAIARAARYRPARKHCRSVAGLALYAVTFSTSYSVTPQP